MPNLSNTTPINRIQYKNQGNTSRQSIFHGSGFCYSYASSPVEAYTIQQLCKEKGLVVFDSIPPYVDILPALKDGDSRRSLLRVSGSTTCCSTREGLQQISTDFDRLSSGKNI